MAGIPYWAPFLQPQAGADNTNPWDRVVLVASDVASFTSAPYTDAFAQDNACGGASFYKTLPAVSGAFIILPGISKVVNIKKDARFAVQEAPGVDNAPVFYMGANPATYDIVCNVWMPSQWAALQDVLAAVFVAPNKGAKVMSYRVGHPLIAARKFSPLAIIKEINGPEDGDYGDAGGSMKVTFSCMEYAPPPAAIVSRPTLIGQAPNAVTGFAGGSPQAAPGAATAVGAKANPPSKAIKPTPG